jgi:hypothetical protein
VNRPEPTPGGPSGYLVAALLVLVLAPPAILGWVAGAVVVRSGWVSRRRLSAAGAVTGALALVVIGPTRAAGVLLGAVAALPAVLPATLTAGAVLEALGAILARGLGLAAVTVPAGIVAATIPPRQDLAVRPEWVEAERRQRVRAEARTHRRVARQVEREGANPRSEALAVSLGGDLDRWRIGDLLVPPPGQLDLAMLLLGQPGVGKSVAISRLAYLAARERRHLTIVDAKGGADGLAGDVAAAVLTGWPDARIGLFPQAPIDLWRGSPAAIVNRLLGCWDFTGTALWYQEVAVVALRLALGQPGPPCRSSAELVTRLQPDALNRAWDGDPEMLNLIRSMREDLAGVHIRVSNLAAALGPAFDGSWSHEDVDVSIITVPALVAPKDADACLRVLLGDYNHFAASRKPAGQASLLIVDEWSAVAGGRRMALDLLERGRGSQSGVVLAGQSTAALGDETERARMLAAVNAVLAFRSPAPADLASLAGSTREAEAAFQVDGDDLTGRQTITMRSRARVDQDQLRSLSVGTAELISAGRRERVRIIKTNIPDSVRTVARGLTAPPIAGTLHPSTPGRAVAPRVSGPPPAPQAPRRPQPRPAASELDPPSSSPIRRYRPPGPGAEASPGSDRGGGEAIEQP